ncbi:MAG TPA: acyltransferase [Mycobacteriales bacterium]|nr:acyltransferase [Mycobacteriales bacterium]HWC34607.1 acyltransferase [Mycobacteriales bacterium]
MTAADPKPARTRLGYRPELDGVRALAVLIVLLYHLTFLVPWLTHVGRGGFLAVDLFFVLSGLLITEILIADVDRLGRIDLIGFYGRRARRLLPALFAFIALTVAWYELAHSDGAAQAQGLWRVLTYTLYGKPDVPGFPFGLSQVWTLVVEWEFYIAWSIALLALLVLRVPRQVIGWLCVAGVAVCTLARIWLLHHDGDVLLNYHLGLLRFQDMLVGCAIALLPVARRIPNIVRSAGVVCLVVVTVRANYLASWVYQWGLLLTALSAGVMIAPRERVWRFDRFLASRPIVWVGVISYSLYLWSVFAVSEVGGHTRSWPLAPRVVAVLAVSFTLASLSYYQVERRFRSRSRRAEPGGAHLLGEPDADATAAP